MNSPQYRVPLQLPPVPDPVQKLFFAQVVPGQSLLGHHLLLNYNLPYTRTCQHTVNSSSFQVPTRFLTSQNNCIVYCVTYRLYNIRKTGTVHQIIQPFLSREFLVSRDGGYIFNQKTFPPHSRFSNIRGVLMGGAMGAQPPPPIPLNQ